MTTLGGNNLGYADVVKRLDPMGNLIPIAEVLDQKDSIIEHMPWLEGNLPTGNRTAARTSEPTVYKHRLNRGDPSSKSTVVQMDEETALFTTWSVVDKEAVRIGGNVAGVRASEARAQAKSMRKALTQELFAGNIAQDPDGFNGFGTRYASPGAAYANSMVDGEGASGQSDCFSMWLIGWGEETVHGIYPKGTVGGLDRHDFGLTSTILDTDIGGATGGNLMVYKEWMGWHAGITIHDWQYVVRVHSLDVSVLKGGTPTNLFNKSIDAFHRIPDAEGVNLQWYVPRSAAIFLHQQALDKVHSAGPVSIQEIAGRPVTHLMGVPVNIIDRLGLEASLN